MDADPYVERELLLVLLDCFLLREEAFRHAMLHRQQYFDSGNCLLIMVTSGAIRALTMVVTEIDHAQGLFFSTEKHGDNIYLSNFVGNWFLNMTEYTFSVIGVYIVLQWISRERNRSEPVEAISSRKFLLPSIPWKDPLWVQVNMAIMIPALLIQLLTLFIQIWETNETTRRLGTVLVLMYQWKCLQTLLRVHQYEKEPQRASTEVLSLLIILILSLIQFLLNESGNIFHNFSCRN